MQGDLMVVGPELLRVGAPSKEAGGVSEHLEGSFMFA